MTKLKIGLIGEDPNDTNSIQNLLIRKYSEKVYFKKLIRNIKGFYLDNPKTLRSLEIEFEDQKPFFVIVIRDLDGLPEDSAKIGVITNWFDSINKKLNNTGIFLLNIFELEALIFANIDVFNKAYKTKIKQNRNPMYIKEPKEELMRKSRQVNIKKEYEESHAPAIFEKLDLDVLAKNCLYFRQFMDAFEKQLS
ncbi:MAG TPA: DUF4276 family protein [Ignavibacteria bacterium]|nr:DUF4276 family protein [Ignavibacteria bacterium]HMQ98019.1 DUF4276 family protein [Ignavibacteria bacterium]